MTAFSDAFQAEVLRVVRKELKGELASLRKTLADQRSEIASLKRELKAPASQPKAASKATTRRVAADKAPAPQQAAPAPARRARRSKFDAQTLVAKREQLGISQQAMAALLGASALSVSRWESGKVMPRAAQLESIQQVLKLGKREAQARLQG